MVSPFKVTVYDRALKRVGFLGAPESISVNVRHNQQGTASLTVGADHRLVGALTAPGARVVIEHKPWPTKYGPAPDWEFLMSGAVVSRRGQGPMKKATVTVEIADDIRYLSGILGWPVPTQPVTNQSGAEYAKYTGPAETVVKAAAKANIQRLGLPITVAPDLGRGATVPGGLSLRFHPLYDKLLPIADAAGIGITVRQSGAGLVLDVYEQRTYKHELSEKSGTITDWSWSDTDPNATRAVTGGKGEGTARVFSRSIDTSLEALYPVREVFKDATDVDTTADLTARAAAEVVDQGPRSGFSVKLSESGMFQYGANGVRVGDRVSVNIGGQARTDVLRECTLANNVTDGHTQTPIIGDIDESPDKAVARWIAKLRTAVNNLTKG
jgi:hypothetical protein